MSCETLAASADGVLLQAQRSAVEIMVKLTVDLFPPNAAPISAPLVPTLTFIIPQSAPSGPSHLPVDCSEEVKREAERPCGTALFSLTHQRRSWPAFVSPLNGESHLPYRLFECIKLRYREDGRECPAAVIQVDSVSAPIAPRLTLLTSMDRSPSV